MVSGVREATGQGVGAVLAGADLVQAAADESPADAPDGERDFADCNDGERSRRWSYRRDSRAVPASRGWPLAGANASSAIASGGRPRGVAW